MADEWSYSNPPCWISGFKRNGPTLTPVVTPVNITSTNASVPCNSASGRPVYSSRMNSISDANFCIQFLGYPNLPKFDINYVEGGSLVCLNKKNIPVLVGVASGHKHSSEHSIYTSPFLYSNVYQHSDYIKDLVGKPLFFP